MVDTTIATNMEACTSWTETAPCSKKILSLSKSSGPDDVKNFLLTSTDCSKGVKLEIFDVASKHATGEFLSYLEIENSSVTVGSDEMCFDLHRLLVDE